MRNQTKQRIPERRKRFFSLFLTLAMIFTITVQPVSADAVDHVTLTVYGKGGEAAWTETWYFQAGSPDQGYLDADFTKHQDGSGGSFPVVKDFTSYPGFEDVGALVFSGYRYNGGFPCLAVCKKGIKLEDLIDYVEKQSGFNNLRGGTGIQVIDPTGWKLPYSDQPAVDGKYDEFYWGNAAHRYYYPNLYENAQMWNISSVYEYINPEKAIEVPIVFSMVGMYYNNRGTTLEDTLKEADSLTCLRLFFGTSTTSPDDTSDLAGNMGNISAKNVQDIDFYPVYSPITIKNGIMNGSEGGSDCSVTAGDVTLTTEDGFFKESPGKTVVLHTSVAAGAELASLSVTDAKDDTPVAVTETEDAYSFIMPENGVNVEVSSVAAGDPNARRISTAADEECSIYADHRYSLEGEMITVTAARSGEALTASIKGITVTTEDGTAVPVENVSRTADDNELIQDASYTFTMPDGEVTVAVEKDYAALNILEQENSAASPTLKRAFSRDDVEAMDEEEDFYYGGFDASPDVVEGRGEGSVALTGLLERAGVELEAGDTITFNTADGQSKSFDYDQLYGTARYYYPNLYTGESRSAKSNSAVAVQPHLITRGTLVKSSSLSGSSLSEKPCTVSGAYRLAFGLSGEEFGTNQDASPSADVLTASGYFSNITEITVSHAVTYDVSWYVNHTEDTDYTISTEAQLRGLAAIVNGVAVDPDNDNAAVEATDFSEKTITLTTDLRLTKVWNPIGNREHAFAGTFDGNGNTISGLRIKRADNGYCGLFGNNTGTIQNLNVSGSIGSESSPITEGNDNIGGVAGYNDGTVTGVTGRVEVSVNSDQIYAVGGLVGQNGENGTIENSANYAGITGTKAVGGIAGRNYGRIHACCNTGSVTGNGGRKDGIGGIVGITGDKNGTYQSSILSCYNTGTVRNDNGRWHGGIAGMADSAAEIRNCYTTGMIGTGYSWNWNPVIGHIDYAYENVSNNYSLEGISSGDTNEETMSQTIGMVLTVDEMRNAVDRLGGDYQANQGCFPVLSWEGTTGHSWDSGVVTEPPGSQNDGVRTYTCDVCELTRTEVIPASGTGDTDPSGLDLTSTTWDGISIDVSWYIGHEKQTSYTIDTAAKLAGAAAIVNGLVNKDTSVYTGQAVIPASEWNDSKYVKNGTGTHGACNRATDDYSFGVDDMNGKTLRVTADLDMSAGNYMPLGGQYLLASDDKNTKLGSSFCGSFDGQGHNITIVCDRWNEDYGDGESVGLIGRLGVHDNDPVSLRPAGPAVRNVAIYGSVYANRSVGGVVGKIGKTTGSSSGKVEEGALIENCANFAFISGTDAKGTGGICGAGWNGGQIRNCYNAGPVKNTHNSYGGIVGSNEIELINCYNIGEITGIGTTAAIATSNGGDTYENCYWLSGTADMGVYKRSLDGVQEKSSAEMKSEEFLSALGSAFAEDKDNINQGYPVLKWQVTGSESPDSGDGGDTPGDQPDDPAVDDGEHETDCPSRKYSDLDPSLWYHEAIDFVLNSKYFQGTSDTTFEPDYTMTRAMFVTVLSRMEGMDAAQYSGSDFTDVETGQWYTAAIQWASRNGIVLGVGEQQFDPNGEVTREQMAAIMYRYAQYKKIDTTKADASKFGSFSDKDSVSDWAVEAMTWATGVGIINGTDTGIEPQANSTRAQVAQIVKNYTEKLS